MESQIHLIIYGHFLNLMRFYVAPDVVRCQSFLSTLRREVREWVATLALRSIKTFDKLSKGFVAYYLVAK